MMYVEEFGRKKEEEEEEEENEQDAKISYTRPNPG